MALADPYQRHGYYRPISLYHFNQWEFVAVMRLPADWDPRGHLEGTGAWACPSGFFTPAPVGRLLVALAPSAGGRLPLE